MAAICSGKDLAVFSLMLLVPDRVNKLQQSALVHFGYISDYMLGLEDCNKVSLWFHH